MASSEVRLDGIEAQESVDAYPRKLRGVPIFPISFIIHWIVSTLRSRGFLPAEEGTEGTESEPKFFIKISLYDLFDSPGESVPMTPEIVTAVSAGKKEWMEKLKSDGQPMACLQSDQGDSVLHVAASWGHLELVKSIVSECPCLLLKLDSRDQLPLHVAARAGHKDVVEALIETIEFVSAKISDDEERSILNLYVCKDINGDTPLHLVLKELHNKDRYWSVASSLIHANRCASFLANKDGISPLYLAVEAGEEVLVKAMLRTRDNDRLEGRKFLVHKALKARRTDILDLILDEYPSLEDERDEEGMTCLSFGASIGFSAGVRKLLNRSQKSVYVCNDDGSFPIHCAVDKRHTFVVHMLVKRCPDTIYLLNKQGQNILHIAAKSGKSSLFFLAGLREISIMEKQLMVKQDVDGNTPIHLAAINWRPRTLYWFLCYFGKKWLNIRNNSGLTALGVVEANTQPNYIFMERVTLMVLSIFHGKSMTKRSDPTASDKNKDYINTLLVVAALVATVTFAAGFTIPGGFNSSDPNLGMATLANDTKLVAFMVFDILAMQSSIVTIATLIWAQLGDPALVQRSLIVALPSLFLALLCMPGAFYFGVLVVFAQVKGLVIFLSISSVIFFFIMLFVLGPHVLLQIPGIPAYFGIYFVPFVWLLDEDASAHASATKISSKNLIEKQEST
ncbi:protein ACCELERATED CELL DEATH 6 [Eutrema salsugineum]|uniref:protein ACCELERATED CELL DEATH 6 n=1 Tax=Eutrema salsugineum TaxID=72664 RepID=UPI000CECF7FC|nr:protein ACCELERATED CELL DEATH 6 [Eutrema salsugineum]